jgi:uncharacterized protein YegL
MQYKAETLGQNFGLLTITAPQPVIANTTAPSHLVLALDVSGSMQEVERNLNVLLQTVIQQLPTHTYLSVCTFNNVVHELISLCPKSNCSDLEKLSERRLKVDGTTNTYAAIQWCATELQRIVVSGLISKGADAKKATFAQVIIVTDGVPTSGTTCDPCEMRCGYYDVFTKLPLMYEVVLLGLGDVDMGTLKELSYVFGLKGEHKATLSASINQLPGQIGQLMAGNVALGPFTITNTKHNIQSLPMVENNLHPLIRYGVVREIAWWSENGSAENLQLVDPDKNQIKDVQCVVVKDDDQRLQKKRRIMPALETSEAQTHIQPVHIYTAAEKFKKRWANACLQQLMQLGVDCPTTTDFGLPAQQYKSVQEWGDENLLDALRSSQLCLDDRSDALVNGQSEYATASQEAYEISYSQQLHPYELFNGAQAEHTPSL